MPSEAGATETSRLFEMLGRLQGTVDAILRGQEDYGQRLAVHLADDTRRLGEHDERLRAIEIRHAGAEATARRMAGLASFLGTAAGVASALLSRLYFGHQ